MSKECPKCHGVYTERDLICPTCKEKLVYREGDQQAGNPRGIRPAVRTVGDEQSKQPINLVEKSIANNRIVIAVGIVILIIGVALIIISPNLLFVEHIPGDLFVRGDRMGGREQITDLRNAAMFGGVVLLIVGGVISAVGFGIKKTISPDQQRPGVLLYRDGQQYGPYQMEAIMEWYESGKLSEKDMVFVKGSNQWVRVSSFLGMNNSTVTSPASNTTSSLDELEKLASLKEKGIVTEEEYEKKKKRILGI